MRRSLAAFASLCSFVFAFSFGCSSSDDASGPTIVGSWKYVDGFANVYLELRDDKTCSYAIENGTATVCTICTYAYGDGVLTLEFAATAMTPKQASSNKADLPDGETLRLESNGKTQLFKRSAIPAAATCK